VHEELLKTLSSGASSACFRMLYETGVLQVLMPSVSDAVEGAGGFLFPLLEALDRHDQGFRSIPDSALIALLLYPVYLREVGDQEDPFFWLEQLREGSPIFTSTRRRDLERILQVFRAQRRFAREAKSRRAIFSTFLRKDYFRDAWLLFKLVSEVTGEHREFVEEWEARISGPRRPPVAPAPPQRYFTPAPPAPGADESASEPLVRRRRRGGRGRRRGGSFDAASGTKP
jgi:tRNA nucleotidyltransferase/poly(A) polymerase